MDVKLSSQELWTATAIFIGLDLLALVPILLLLRAEHLQPLERMMGAASALFWGILAIVLILGFWGFYYQYIFPPWVRWLTPLDALLYGVLGVGIWWLARSTPGPTALWFVIFGGLEGITEHLLGIYGFRILEKVPWLEGIDPLPTLVFSFFEYVLYWTLVLWLAFVLIKLVNIFQTP